MLPAQARHVACATGVDFVTASIFHVYYVKKCSHLLTIIIRYTFNSVIILLTE